MKDRGIHQRGWNLFREHAIMDTEKPFRGENA